MTATAPGVDVPRLQRRTIRLLATTQILGGVGVAMGVSVGSLLLYHLTGGPGLSGFGQAMSVIGGALVAIPVVRVTNLYGRRPGLALAYATGIVGALVLVAAIVAGSAPLAFVGMFFFGGGTAANLQARYAATDLAEPARRGRQLSMIVWATTVGAVAGPLLMPKADGFIRGVLDAPQYVGPFVVSAIGFLLAGIVLWFLLRPDPLLVARRVADAPEMVKSERGLGAGWRAVRGNGDALLGLTAVALGHLVMVGVMVMTPVHIQDTMEGHAHAGHTGSGWTVEGVVGVIISLHIAGMYAFSPIVGWAADRFGRRAVILSGIVLLIAACATAGTAGDGTPQLAAGLVLLGLGWSCTMVAGSALLTESVDVARRASAQALSDVTMGVAGAVAGALSGVVMDAAGYPILALCAAVTTVPVVVAALRARRR
ncbi:MFS transporter [Phytomonospora endophytica]|uniref:MFS family permease n=1 Tax=Phytomonospora endophytica TaxID=714109 RepID=A0A841FM04_9ACTN|nr:MFS transporter [Phytomonospora endophytica]MBB6033639.1 MFS family permease [Phytomonospora endophytica]GIG64845.1 putative MFS-type transporter YdeG [Phytomonospora endophytica]